MLIWEQFLVVVQRRHWAGDSNLQMTGVKARQLASKTPSTKTLMMSELSTVFQTF